jgi:hypothetical protein
VGSLYDCRLGPFPQAARTSVKGDEYWHGFKIRFETTWLEKP